MGIKTRVTQHFTRMRKFYTYGLPFIVTVLGSSFMFSQFQSLRYELKKKRNTPVPLDKPKYRTKKEQDLADEKLFKEMVSVKRDTWETVPIPKPY